MRSASEVFAYFTFLLLFISIERAALGYLRYHHINEINFSFIISSQWWAVRTIPELVIITLIVIRMARRAVRTIRLERRYSSNNACEGYFDETNGREEKG